jgi:diaminopimelate epimerase
MKMHGLGNDFVVIDARSVAPHRTPEITPEIARAMADRHCGIGFDQLAVLRDSDVADLHLSFLNADGSPAQTCGNASRCIARHLMQETGQAQVRLATDHALMQARDAGGGLTSVNMGQAATDWQAIPLARALDTLELPIKGAPVATSMGNPHCTFFVEDAEAVDLATRGPAVEHHPLFPERTNVQFASLTGPDTLRMRVWERGTGITLASGSSSCATAHAAHRRGLVGRNVTLHLDGGTLQIDLAEDGIWMTGPTAHAFDGIWRG